MRSLEEMAAECIAELNVIGIKTGDVSFTVNTRAKKRWGQCRALGGGRYEISISYRLLADGSEELPAKNTIIHELLHAADGCRSGHRGRWLQLAADVMRAYPEYDIKRCSSAEEKDITDDNAEVKRLEYRYFFRCLGCGTEARYKRAAKFTKNPNAYVCVKCRGKFVDSELYSLLSPEQRSLLETAMKAAAPRPLTKSLLKQVLDK